MAKLTQTFHIYGDADNVRVQTGKLTNWITIDDGNGFETTVFLSIADLKTIRERITKTIEKAARKD